MKKNKWDDSLSVGSEVIDNEHKILFDLAKDLHNSITVGADNRTINTLFSVIIDYFHQHFEREESLLVDKEGYLGHCAEHYQLIKKIHDYIVAFRNSRSVDTPPGEFLHNWLWKHIHEVDIPAFDTSITNFDNEPEIDCIEAFVLPEDEKKEIPITDEPDKRKHKRISYEKLLDSEIVGLCYNTKSMKNSSVQIEDLAAGGLRIVSKQPHDIGDLLIINCSVGTTFKMKEKAKVRNNFGDNKYGVEFVSPKPQTVEFLTQICGAVGRYSK